MEKAVFHYDGNVNIVKSFMFCNSKRIDGTSAAVNSEAIDSVFGGIANIARAY